jgi:hypothetical protein
MLSLSHERPGVQSTTADRGKDEDFACIANRLEDATGTHIAVDGDSDGRFDVTVFNHVLAQAGVQTLEVVDQLAHIAAGGDDPIFAIGVFAEQRGDNDGSHFDGFILAERDGDGDREAARFLVALSTKGCKPLGRQKGFRRTSTRISNSSRLTAP